RLTELAARKPKANDAAPLPFVLSTASFKLRVEDSSLTGTVDIAGNVLDKGFVKVPLTTGLTLLEARQANNALPFSLDGLREPASVWWTAREIAAPVAQREVRFLSDIKSDVSVGDSQMRVTALCDITVIQGDAAEFRMPLPAGFELTEATGPTLDSFANDKGVLVLNLREQSHR